MNCPCCGTEKLKILPLSELEKHYILAIYNFTNRSARLTCKYLGIGTTTLYRKLALYKAEGVRKYVISRSSTNKTV